MFESLWTGFKKLARWVLLLLIIAIAGSIGKLLVQAWMKPSDREILSKVVSEAVQRVNAQTPKQIDEITRLDKVEAVGGYKMRMYHTLLNYQAYAKDFDIKRAQAVITKDLCAKQTKNSPLHLGFVWEYVYKQENGAEVGRFEIAKNECSGSYPDV